MEDFAETFALYILQGSTFAEWSETNTVLLEKYEFMKKIYRGEEFESAKTYDTRPFSVIDYPIDFGTAIAIAQ